MPLGNWSGRSCSTASKKRTRILVDREISSSVIPRRSRSCRNHGPKGAICDVFIAGSAGSTEEGAIGLGKGMRVEYRSLMLKLKDVHSFGRGSFFPSHKLSIGLAAMQEATGDCVQRQT